jgi:hypothetical protein
MTRPRLQLHLSTLLIVSLMVAWLLWLNVGESHGELKERPTEVFVVQSAQGWPFIFARWTEEKYVQRLNELGDSEPGSSTKRYDTLALAYNVFICLALLIAAAVAIEWATRRMKRGASRD